MSEPMRAVPARPQPASASPAAIDTSVPHRDHQVDRTDHDDHVVAPDPRDPGSRAWLSALEKSEQARIALYMWRGVYTGATTAATALLYAMHSVGQDQGAIRDNPIERERLNHIVEAVYADYEGALQYAAHVLAEEEQAMAAMPAIEDQLSLLRRLGHTGPVPVSVLDANRLIRQYRRGRRR
jgi:hypothetical protein